MGNEQAGGARVQGGGEAMCKVIYIHDTAGFRVQYCNNALFGGAHRYGLRLIGENDENADETDVLLYCFDPEVFMENPAPMKERLHELIDKRNIKYVALVVGMKQPPAGVEQKIEEVFSLTSMGCEHSLEKDFLMEGDIALQFCKDSCAKNPKYKRGPVHYVQDLAGFRIDYVRDSLVHSSSTWGVEFMDSPDDSSFLLYTFDPWNFMKDSAFYKNKLHEYVRDNGITHLAVIVGGKEPPVGIKEAPKVLELESLGVEWCFEPDFMNEGSIVFPFLQKAVKVEPISVKPAKAL